MEYGLAFYQCLSQRIVFAAQVFGEERWFTDGTRTNFTYSSIVVWGGILHIFILFFCESAIKTVARSEWVEVKIIFIAFKDVDIP